MNLEHLLDLCDREIAAMQTQTGIPAWLVTLGIEDWRAEQRWLTHQAGSAIAKACRQAGIDAATLRRADNLRWAAVAKLAGLERTRPHFPCDAVRAEAIRLLEATS